MSSYELFQNMGLLQLLKSQFLCHLIICYVFLVSGFIINLLQLCTLPVWLVSKQLARRINIRLAYCISSRMYNLSCTITTWLFPRSRKVFSSASGKKKPLVSVVLLVWCCDNPLLHEFPELCTAWHHFTKAIQVPFTHMYLFASLSLEMVAILEWWSGTECTLYTDPKSYPLYGKENAIVVLNHAFEIDFLCGWTFCERFGVLGVSESKPENFTHPSIQCFPPVLSMCSQLPELKSVSQKTAGLCTDHRLDVVLLGDSFLQKEMGGRSKDGEWESWETAGLPRKLLGGFQSVVILESRQVRVIFLWP